MIPLLMDNVCVLYNAVNKSIYCSHVFIPVGESQANDLRPSFPAYYFLPPSVSSVTFYIQLSHFLTEPQCTLNFTSSPWPTHHHHHLWICNMYACQALLLLLLHTSLPPPLLLFGYIFRRICKTAKCDY